MGELKRNPHIVSIGLTMPYREAFRTVRNMDGLPTNAMHDKALVDLKAASDLHGQGLYPAWASTMIVTYPREGEYKRGRDITVEHMLLPAYFVPRDFRGFGSALIIEPEELDLHRGKIVVFPDFTRSIVIENFPQRSMYGIAEETTRIPTDLVPSLLLSGMIRRLLRPEAPFMAPVVRHAARDPITGRLHGTDVCSVADPNSLLGVSYFGTE